MPGAVILAFYGSIKNMHFIFHTFLVVGYTNIYWHHSSFYDTIHIYQVGCPYDSKLKWAHFYSSWFSNFIWNCHRSGYWGRVSEILRFLHRCLTRGCSQGQYLWGVRKSGLGKGRRWARIQLLGGLCWSYTSFGAGMLLQVVPSWEKGCWLSLGRITLGKVASFSWGQFLKRNGVVSHQQPQMSPLSQEGCVGHIASTVYLLCGIVLFCQKKNN